MKLPFTISLYIARNFCFNIFIVMMVVIAIMLLSTFVEIMRQAYGKNIPIYAIINITFCKLPHLIEKTSPFLMLLGGILCFSKLTKSRELIVARASGISAWQFLTPCLLTAIFIMVIMVAIINPLAARTISQGERISFKYLKESPNLLNISQGGLWLRENDANINRIIHAKLLEQKRLLLKEVIFFIFNQDGKFDYRIDAKEAKLENGKWIIRNASIVKDQHFAKQMEEYIIPTDLAISKLYDSFLSPDSIAFWELPNFIATIKAAGFSPIKYQMHFYYLILSPIFAASMVLIAAVFSLKPSRNYNTNLLMVSGIIVGFLVYFIKDIVYVLGLSGSIPVLIASISPILLTMLAGTLLIFHYEDG